MKIRVFALCLLALLIISTKGYAQKIDTIYHINGNTLTGDFKMMTYGVVTWKMDGMGTISLEEPKIRTIKSVKQFEIKMDNGLIYFGSLDTSNIDHHVYIVLTNGRELVDISDIVEVYPIRNNFWRRTTGNFSVGINYTLASNVLTSVVSGNIAYRKRKSYYNLAWDSNNTWQKTDSSLENTASKVDVSFAWQRLFAKGWSIGTVVGVSQNLELGTELRFDFTPLGIYDVVYNNWNRLWVGAGLSAQRETPYNSDSASVTNDLAGILAIEWKVYKYTNPKVWVDANISFIPYFTNDERYRANFSLNPKISVVGNDLKVGLRFYYSYDSSPSTGAEASFDWGINFELTYTLH